MWLVTIKLERNPDHDPANKVEGPCPVTGRHCTDVTGQHHTVLTDLEGLTPLIREHHVTRIELV